MLQINSNEVPYQALPAKKLQNSIKDLETMTPWPGLVKTALLAGLFTLTTLQAMLTPSELHFIFYSVLSGLLGASLLILTHDAIHNTLTGIKFFDENAPRFTNALFWFHGLYKEIHKIHHKMNGDDLRDPERVQWTLKEYQNASPLIRFYVRNQWFIDIFVLAGFGLIGKTLYHALKHYHKSKGIRRELFLDVLGILVANIIIYSLAISAGLGLKYFIFWLIIERISGGILQWRAHIEHYGLWGKRHHFFETQLSNCRNISTHPLIGWYFNYLNYHSAHHAFPKIPFYKLKEAHKRFDTLFKEENLDFALYVENGYLSTSLKLARHPAVIDEDSASHKQGLKMIAIRT